MKGSSRIGIFIFCSLTLISIVVLIVSFIGAVSWVNKPFAGLLVYDFPLVGSMSLSDWPGRQAGIKLLERIVSVDGNPVRKGLELVKAARNKAPGSTVALTVESRYTWP